MGVTVEFAGRHQGPARRQHRSKRAAYERCTRQIPDRGLTRAGVEQGVVHIAVTIKIGSVDDVPARWKRRTGHAPRESIVSQEPDRTPARAAVEQDQVWEAVPVEIRCHPDNVQRDRYIIEKPKN